MSTTEPTIGEEGIEEMPEWFYRLVVVGDADECWVFKGSLRAGYGRVSVKGKTFSAHRTVYELLVGPIPVGMVIDHTCHNRDENCPGGRSCPHRACCNPRHLDPTSVGENVLRGKGISAREAAQTHCKRGHEFTAENTYIHPPHGGRDCRICKRDNLEQRRARARQERRSA